MQGSNLLQRVPKWAWWTAGGVAATGFLGLWAVLYRDGKVAGVSLLRRVDGVPLTLRAAGVFTAMQTAAAADGVVLKLNSGFRSMAEQTALYAKYLLGIGNLAAKPGYSNHQGGTAYDIDVNNSTSSAAYRWLEVHARQFGIHRTVSSEPWHWELV